jgi:hypothetical protein
MTNLFDSILENIADLDPFTSKTSPTIFLIYAHDEKAKVEIPKQIITWLKRVRAKLRSDQSPLGTGIGPESSLDIDEHAAHNILWNQFCLLPNTSYDKSVDKVILCCSEVLSKYHGKFQVDPTLIHFYQDIKEAHSRSPKNAQHPTELHFEIEQVINQYIKKDGFHHVVTELALLDIRKEAQRETGVIPVILDKEAELFISLPGFVRGTDLWIDRKLGSIVRTESSRPLHKLFFKLLQRLYIKNQRVLNGFEACYNDCVQWLESVSNGPEPVSPERFVDYIHKAILNVKYKLSNDLSAFIRGDERQGNSKFTYSSKCIIEHSPTPFTQYSIHVEPLKR